MMRAQQAGFTLVEMLMVAVLGAFVLGAAYKSLIVQEESYRVTSHAAVDQDALRTALGVLESELREVNTSGGSAGLPDIITASSDNLVFRASRGIAFVCGIHPSDKKLDTWSLGSMDLIEPGDVVLVFADGSNGQIHSDDEWKIAEASKANSSSASCPSRPGGGSADQNIELATLPGGPTVDGNFLSGVVHIGAPVRAMQEVTYGLYEFDSGWGLGRSTGGEVEELIGGLDEPGEGLTFTYLDYSGTPITSDPVTDPTAIAAIEITARTLPRAGNQPIDLETSIFLRNN